MRYWGTWASANSALVDVVSGHLKAGSLALQLASFLESQEPELTGLQAGLLKPGTTGALLKKELDVCSL